MSRTLVVCTVLAAGAIAGCHQPSTPAPVAAGTVTTQEEANAKLVLDWWREVLEARHLELTSKYQADDYIQHNIDVPTGRRGFVAFFSPFFEKVGPVVPIPATLKHPPVVQLAKANFVVLVWENKAKDPADPSKTYPFHAYDLLRVEGGKIQEHWDYAVKTKGVPRGGAPDGIDYARVKLEHTAAEQKNIEVATVALGKKPTLMFASGPYVFAMTKLTEKDPDDPGQTYPAYWFDLVRVEDGVVREHWDSATRPAPPPTAPH
jgi:predicted SnoaL-like aldol condensation-catalyzing enzyme